MPTSQSRRWIAPPVPLRGDGAVRRVGVEIEFSGVPVARAAESVATVFGGTVRLEDAHNAVVAGTRHGDFRVELDMALAHARIEDGVERFLRDVAVEIGSAVIPVEIVCPPIPWDEAHALDDLGALLHRMGAEGTRDALFYAFGAQLNVEPPSLRAPDLRDHMRAFVILRDWLRAEIAVDTLRALWVFAGPWPDAYCDLLLAPGYAPDLRGLIDDYLAFNPMRDRDLDALPLFAALDEPRVRAVSPGEKIRPRPAWHYRLPNSEVNDRDWSIGLEWERWVRVERLATAPGLLAQACGEWRANVARLLPHDWTARAAAIARSL